MVNPQVVVKMPAFANSQTDWARLSDLLRLAQRDGWVITFGNERVFIVHRNATESVMVLPMPLLGHARRTGWRIDRRFMRFELWHPAVRQRIEVSLLAA